LPAGNQRPVAGPTEPSEAIGAKVREGATVEDVPPSAINWNDADDDNAFHSKNIVIDLDGSISTEVGI
jgi:hypothetical protein